MGAMLTYWKCIFNFFVQTFRIIINNITNKKLQEIVMMIMTMISDENNNKEN